MDIVNGLALSTDVFVEIEPNVALGAPADPTALPVQITYSATSRLGGSPSWGSAVWHTDAASVPARRWAKGAVARAQLAEGVWYPFVKITVGGGNEPIVAGPPFRVQGGAALGPADSDA